MGRESNPITLGEWTVIVRSIVRVLRDSSRIEDIHRVAEITSRSHFTTLLHDLRRQGGPLLDDRPCIRPDNTDLDALGRLPADTLGGAYARHMQANALSMYVDPVPSTYVSDPDVRYLMHRYRQVHDIWHVLLGLGTAAHEEVLVHAFILGHMGLPNSALIVGLGAIKHGLLESRWGMQRRIRRAYASGRDARPLIAVRWEASWPESLAAIRDRYRIDPLGVAATRA